ncbi:MAG: alpha/beta fold hydrolase [Cyclobacteriaceae bacterium]
MKYLQKYANEHSRFLVIENALVHYRIEGKGYPLFLLHGAFSSLHTYDDWTEQLSKYYQVIRVDLPGFGLSGSRVDHDYSMKGYLQFLNEFLDRIGVKQCHMVGSSLGGWLSWEYALKNPKRVKNLILIGSAGFLEDKNVPLPFKMARTPFLNKVIKYAVKRNILEQFVRQVYCDQSKVTQPLIERYYDLFSREGNPEAFLALANGKYKDNTRNLKKIKSPTLILWGEEDAWLPLENAYKFQDSIPKSKLIIYEHVGHIPMEEIPQISAKDARAFLK